MTAIESIPYIVAVLLAAGGVSLLVHGIGALRRSLTVAFGALPLSLGATVTIGVSAVSFICAAVLVL